MRVGLRIKPLYDAVHMEAVGTDAPNNRTVVAGQGAFGTAVLKVHTAYAAVIIVGQPAPSSNPGPICRIITKKWCRFAKIYKNWSFSVVTAISLLFILTFIAGQLSTSFSLL